MTQRSSPSSADRGELHVSALLRQGLCASGVIGAYRSDALSGLVHLNPALAGLFGVAWADAEGAGACPIVGRIKQDQLGDLLQREPCGLSRADEP